MRSGVRPADRQTVTEVPGPPDRRIGNWATWTPFPTVSTCTGSRWAPAGRGSFASVGATYEAITAQLRRRERCDLYHAALIAHTTNGSFTLEMTPVPNGSDPAERGVVAEGPVGMRWARRPADLPLRDPSLARRDDPGSAVRRRQPGADHRGCGACATGDRRVAAGPDPHMGPRRAGHRRHVELQLGHRLGADPSRADDRCRSAPTWRPSSRLGRRPGRGPDRTSRRLRAPTGGAMTSAPSTRSIRSSGNAPKAPTTLRTDPAGPHDGADRRGPRRLRACR